MSDKFNPRIKRPFNVILHSADEVELRVGSWNPVSFNITDDQKTGRVSRFIEALDGKDTPKKIGDDIGMSTEEVDNLIEQLRILDVLEEEPLTALDHYLDQNLPTLRTWGVPDLPKSVMSFPIFVKVSLNFPCSAWVAFALASIIRLSLNASVSLDSWSAWFEYNNAISSP